MPKTANRHRAEVAIPGFGDGAFIRFTIDAMERMASEYPEDWFKTVVERTAVPDPKVFKVVLTNAAVDEIDTALLDDAPLMEVRDAILDAMFLAVHGKTVAEQMEQEEQERLKQLEAGLEKMGEDPRIAEALLFLQKQSAEPGTAPASAQTRFEDLPQEK